MVDEDKLLHLAKEVKEKFANLRSVICPQCGKSAQLVDITIDKIAYLCKNCEFEWGFAEAVDSVD